MQRTYLVVAEVSPRSIPFAFSTLIEDVAPLVLVRMKGERLADKSRGDEHLKGEPCLAAISRAIMLGVLGENKRL